MEFVKLTYAAVGLLVGGLVGYAIHKNKLDEDARKRAESAKPSPQ